MFPISFEKLYKSRLAQAELESMKQQAEQMQERRLDSFQPTEEGNEDQKHENKTFDLLCTALRKYCGKKGLMPIQKKS
jgi:hypothetical protein